MKNKFKGYWSGMPIFKFKLLCQQSHKERKSSQIQFKKRKMVYGENSSTVDKCLFDKLC